jgi:Ca2+-dependent lipid-binding protein
MGCGSGQKEVTAPIRLRTVTGKLKITITSATIFHEVSVFKMDPYLLVRLSNQCFTSKVAEKADKTPTFNETFSFFVNS